MSKGTREALNIYDRLRKSRLLKVILFVLGEWIKYGRNKFLKFASYYKWKEKLPELYKYLENQGFKK